MKITKGLLAGLFARRRKRVQWYANPPPKYSPLVDKVELPDDMEDMSDWVFELPQPTLFSPYMNYQFWYRGQLHTHSDYDPSFAPWWLGGATDDGKQAPEEVEKAYRDKGYTFISLTGHTVLTPDPGVQGILHITGAESGEGCRHHLLGLDIGTSDLSEDLVEETCECEKIQPRINYFLNRGGIVVLAHPMADHSGGWPHVSCDSGWSFDDVMFSYGYHGIEVFNSTLDSRYYWDGLLCAGKRVWGFGVDDWHQKPDEKHVNFNRSWIVVNSDKTEANPDALQLDIVKNIKIGNFYTVLRSPDKRRDEDTGSDGPTDYLGPALRIDAPGKEIRVTTDQPSIITFVCGRLGFPPEVMSDIRFSAANTPTTYTLDGWEAWVRVEILQSRCGEAYLALSQPLFPRH